MNKWISFITVLMMVWLSSCSDNPRSTGRYYMPDMYYSQAYETYGPNPNFEDHRNARLPVMGTIPRGVLPDQPTDDPALQEVYHLSYMYKKYFKDTPEDYELAGQRLQNPIKLTDQVVAEGAQIYATNCQVCHGAKGDGKGSIVETGAFPPVPDYKTLLANKPVGKMFHSITYGRNLMGAYASQVKAEDRWKVIYYIQKLAGVGPFLSESKPAESDSVAVN